VHLFSSLKEAANRIIVSPYFNVIKAILKLWKLRLGVQLQLREIMFERDVRVVSSAPAETLA
jgi:hypothetical protein